MSVSDPFPGHLRQGGWEGFSIALDPATFEPCVSFVQSGQAGGGTAHGLMFARRKDDTWEVENVDPVTHAHGTTSLAFNPVISQPEIAYLDGQNSALKLAEWTDNSWTLSTPDSTGIVTADPGLGDVNADACCDNTDSQLTLNFFAQVPSPGFLPERADEDRNAFVDNADAQQGLNFFANVQPGLPVN